MAHYDDYQTRHSQRDDAQTIAEFRVGDFGKPRMLHDARVSKQPTPASRRQELAEKIVLEMMNNSYRHVDGPIDRARYAVKQADALMDALAKEKA